MILPITEDYVATTFYQNCGKPSYNRVQKIYQGSCPICREGNSWIKKRRCYYIVEKNAICCHNCGWYSNPYQWIVKVTGKSFKEIKNDLENVNEEIFFNKLTDNKPVKNKNTEILPTDAINLFDHEQIQYFKNNPVIRKSIEVITERRLDRAINRPNSLYISLVDKVHDNRLIIPFYDNKKIIFYQSRSIDSEDSRSKYLSKVGSEKSLYGIDNVKDSLEYIFILEGPIDAMFVQNGVAVAGINESNSKNFTETQISQFKKYPLHKRIWVLDNQHCDGASKTKTKKLIDSGETVFIWPDHLSGYKDINEFCMDKGINAFDVDTIIDNSFSGLKGKLLVTNN